MDDFKPIGAAAAKIAKRLDANRLGQFEAVAQRRDERRALYHAEQVMLDMSDDEYERNAERAQRIRDALSGFDD